MACIHMPSCPFKTFQKVSDIGITFSETMLNGLQQGVHLQLELESQNTKIKGNASFRAELIYNFDALWTVNHLKKIWIRKVFFFQPRRFMFTETSFFTMQHWHKQRCWAALINPALISLKRFIVKFFLKKGWFTRIYLTCTEKHIPILISFLNPNNSCHSSNSFVENIMTLKVPFYLEGISSLYKL